MKLRIGTRSVGQKLALVVLATTTAALLVMGAAMVMYDVRSYQQSSVSDLATQADILGRASAAALAFDDPKAARETLSFLKAKPRIAAAALYTAKGGLFASYVRGERSDPEFPQLPDSDGYRIEGNQLVLFKRIVDNNEIVGTVYLRGSYELTQRLRDYLVILGLAALISLLAAGGLSLWLQAALTKPIAAVTDIARQVMERRDFTLRARKTTEDEIGYLVDAFNDMLAEIGRQAAILEEANRTLEHEAADRRNAEEALHVSERRNRTLIAAVTSVVWAADRKGRFTEEQISWAKYTGQERMEYHDQGWRHAFHTDDRSALGVAWARSTDDANAFELELRLWHAESQRHRYVSVRAVPLVEPGGEVREWIGTVSDVDDQRRTQKELRELNADLERRVTDRTAQLEAANKELEGFSYSVSHDLRAPIRAISGFSKLLLQDHAAQLDQEARRKLDIVMSETRRMGLLIDDLLAFSRLGRQAMRVAELDMRDLVEGTYGRLSTQNQGSKADFHLGILPRAMGDRALLEQVWTNFLSNALKFTSKRDKPQIEVGAISDSKEHVYFVRDNGAGFDPRFQSKLFGVFQRLHDARDFPGTGVGLALVHRIVTRHGGRVWADSKLEEGATFYFTLPKEPVNAIG